MHLQFRALLRKEIIEIVERIEAFANGKQVDVAVIAELREANSTITPLIAHIEIPTLDNVIGLVHEILHAKRSWPEQVPQMIPQDPQLHSMAGHVDNVLEHLVVLPEQWHFGYGSLADLVPGFMADWSPDSAIRQCADRRTRHLNLLLLFLPLAHFAPGSREHQVAESCLRQEGILDRAKQFVAQIQESLGSKERMVGIAVDTFNIRPGIRLARMDPRVQRAFLVEIPATEAQALP